MDILYVSHCVPWPPDKGERIHAFHSVSQLAEHHRVHLACIARNQEQATVDAPLCDRLASVHIAVLDRLGGVLRGAVSVARGHSFTMGCYGIPELHAHVRSVMASNPIGAVILNSAATTSYAPTDIPFLADWGDVDSEKFLQYARMRPLGPLYWLEGRRLRREEISFARRARRTYMSTLNESRLFEKLAPGVPMGCSTNGVDPDYYDPRAVPMPGELAGRNIVTFVGTLNYFPNADGVCWFADNVFPALRQREAELELFLVGRDPLPDVVKLGQRPGITVTGSVPDVRPYLAASRGAVIPLRLARGLQNKVMEALTMGKRVLASQEVCSTFQPDLPAGIIGCASVDDYASALDMLPISAEPDPAIMEMARRRFSWSACVAPILEELERIEQPTRPRRQTA